MTHLLTTAELAELKGVSPSAISRQVAAGKLTPALQMPGKRGAFLFDPAQLEDELEASA